MWAFAGERRSRLYPARMRRAGAAVRKFFTTSPRAPQVLTCIWAIGFGISFFDTVRNDGNVNELYLFFMISWVPWVMLIREKVDRHERDRALEPHEILARDAAYAGAALDGARRSLNRAINMIDTLHGEIGLRQQALTDVVTQIQQNEAVAELSEAQREAVSHILDDRLRAQGRRASRSGFWIGVASGLTASGIFYLLSLYLLPA